MKIETTWIGMAISSLVFMNSQSALAWYCEAQCNETKSIAYSVSGDSRAALTKLCNERPLHIYYPDRVTRGVTHIRSGLGGKHIGICVITMTFERTETGYDDDKSVARREASDNCNEYSEVHYGVISRGSVSCVERGP